MFGYRNVFLLLISFLLIYSTDVFATKDEIIFNIDYGKVEFTHKDHIKRLKSECTKCHHTWKKGENNGKMCKDCHKKLRDGMAVNNLLSTREAFHNTCQNTCHSEAKKANKPGGPITCTQCHNTAGVSKTQLDSARSTVGKALYKEKRINMDIFKGMGHPSVPAPPAASKDRTSGPPSYVFLFISVHLNEGYAFDDDSPVLKRSIIELERDSKERCIRVLRTVWGVRKNLPEVQRIMVSVTHGVQVFPKGNNVSRHIYAISMPFNDFINNDLEKIKGDELMKSCKVELNDIRPLTVRTGSISRGLRP